MSFGVIDLALKRYTREEEAAREWLEALRLRHNPPPPPPPEPEIKTVVRKPRGRPKTQRVLPPKPPAPKPVVSVEKYAQRVWVRLVSSVRFKRTANHTWLDYQSFIKEIGLPPSTDYILYKDPSHHTYTRFSVSWVRRSNAKN